MATPPPTPSQGILIVLIQNNNRPQQQQYQHKHVQQHQQHVAPETQGEQQRWVTVPVLVVLLPALIHNRLILKVIS